MDNFLKVICSLFLFVAVIATEFAWFDQQPGQITWIVRIAGPIVAVLSLAAILKLYFRHDIARDYLMESMGEYFNRNGFCFKFDIADTLYIKWSRGIILLNSTLPIGLQKVMKIELTVCCGRV